MEYKWLYKFAMWTYAGQLVQVEVPENTRSAAYEKVYAMAMASRSWIDVDEGIALNDEHPY